MINMEKAFVISILISMSATAPISEDAQAETLSYENKNDGQGSYEFSFKTSNRIERNETGRLVNIGQPNEHLEVRGFYSYLDPEGKLVIVPYSADENGYHIESDMPMIPPEIDLFPPIMPISLPPAVVATLLGG